MNIVTNQKKQFIKLGKIIPNSESINIYAIVTEFAIHHHEGLLFYSLRLVDETLGEKKCNSIPCVFSIADSGSSFDGFMTTNMIIRIQNCMCKRTSNNQAQLYGIFGNGTGHARAVAFSIPLLRLDDDSDIAPTFRTYKNSLFDHDERHRIKQLFNFFLKIYPKSNSTAAIQCHSDYSNLLIDHHSFSKNKENSPHTENKNQEDLLSSFDIADSTNLLQHQTRGKPIDQIPLQQENNPDAIENVPMEQDSSNSSICFDPEEYLENLGGKIDELKQVESGTRRFSDISQKLTKDDPRRYFDIICQVLGIYVPQSDDNAPQLLLLMVSDGTKIPASLQPFYPPQHCLGNETIFGKADISALANYFYVVSCFDSYAEDAKKIPLGSFVRITNMKIAEKYRNSELTFTLNLHGKHGGRFKRGFKILNSGSSIKP